jgi:hypothetical protein
LAPIARPARCVKAGIESKNRFYSRTAQWSSAPGRLDDFGGAGSDQLERQVTLAGDAKI